jgi:transposase
MDDVRLSVTDEIWARLEPIIAGVKSAAGAPAELSDREFVEAVLFRARTGCPWRDLPACFGAWDAVYNRFRRWEAIGVWKALAEQASQEGLEAIKTLLIDSTIVRVHQHGAGASKKKGARRSKGSAAAVVASRPKSTSRPLTKKRPLPLC